MQLYYCNQSPENKTPRLTKLTAEHNLAFQSGDNLFFQRVVSRVGACVCACGGGRQAETHL